MNYPNLTETELKTKIAEFLLDYPTSSLKGSITVLGEPYVRMGDVVQLRIDNSHINDVENLIEDKDDDVGIGYTSYYVDSVNTSFGSDGLRQELTLGKKYIN